MRERKLLAYTNSLHVSFISLLSKFLDADRVEIEFDYISDKVVVISNFMGQIVSFFAYDKKD